jgi:hypothetical protein
VQVTGVGIVFDVPRVAMNPKAVLLPAAKRGRSRSSKLGRLIYNRL